MMRTWLPLAALVACSGPADPDQTLPPRHSSATQHEQAAIEHEREADVHEAEATRREQTDPDADKRCFDQSVPSVSETGGEPLEILRPCWTSLTSPSARERREADEHREVAAAHRARAKKLRTAEAQHCEGFGEAELSRGPFSQRRDVLAVTEVRDGDTLRGARIEFRKVPGLDAAWMERALACHQARAAVLGYPTGFMGYSPATLPDVDIAVAPGDEAIVVTITSERSEIAAAAVGRARDLRRKGGGEAVDE